MNTIVGLILLMFVGVDPNTGQPLLTIDQPPIEMTAEQCIEKANEINHDPTNKYTAVCSPKLGDRGA